MPIQEELTYLLEKQLEKQLSGAEAARLLHLLQREENRLLLEDLIQKVLEERRYSEQPYPYMTIEELFESMMQMVETKQNKLTPVRRLSSRSYIKRSLPYAASLLLLAGAASWFLFKPGKDLQKASATRTVASAASSASNKVMLTLADGSQVALDNVKEGALNKQTGVQVIISNKGGIIYKVSDQVAHAGAPSYNTITTPKGEQYHVILPDNTGVWLNAASSLKFPVSFSGKNRTVVLAGEGYFEVAKDASKPFIVKVNDMAVNVLGTNFNIMAYSDENAIKTTLLEGSVKLTQNTVNTVLAPGQQGSLSPDGTAFTISRPKLKEVIAWKNGEFRFEDTQLENIMRQIARWYDLTIVYDGNFSDITLSGVISRKEKALQLLEILEATHRVHFKMEANRVSVMPYNKK